MEIESVSLNFKIFSDSIVEFVDNLSANTIIMSIMMIFMLAGAVDMIRGNKLGYGKEFEKGIELIAPLVLVIASVIAVSPLLSKIILMIFGGIFSFVGIDVSTIPAVILGPDLGGYYIAMELAESEDIGNFSGLIISSVLGPTISFTIPIIFSKVYKKDYAVISAGILVGLLTVPIGCILGGLSMNAVGYVMSIKTIMVNCVPAISLTIFIIFGICIFPISLIKWFTIFGKGITVIITALLAVAIFQQVTGIKLPYLYIMSVPQENTGITGLDSGLLVAGQIGIVLAGALPMLLWLNRVFQGPVKRMGNAIGLDKKESIAFIASLANVIPSISMLNEMSNKGKFINAAFIVTGGAVLGDFIGFAASVNHKMIIPMLIGKATAGIATLILANILAPKIIPIFTSRLSEQLL